MNLFLAFAATFLSTTCLLQQDSCLLADPGPVAGPYGPVLGQAGRGRLARAGPRQAIAATGFEGGRTATGGYALSFDGIDDQARIADTALLSGGPGKSITVEIWAKLQSVSGHHPLVTKFLDTRWKEWGLEVDGGQVVVDIENNADNWAAMGGSVPAGVWTHVAFTFDNAADIVRLYVNGTEVASRSQTNDMPDTQAIVSLGYHYDDYLMVGVLDELRIWNQARSAPAIQADMHRLLQGDEPGLIGYWRFDEASGQSSVDLTGNGNSVRLGLVDASDVADPAWLSSDAPLSGETIPLQVISPNGGEWWKTGSTYEITWLTSGSVANVAIELSADGGASWTTIAASTPDDGAYSWQVEDPPWRASNSCFIRVADAADADPADVSNREFFIVPSSLVNFTASPDNPVLLPGASGSWDEKIRERGWFMYENGTYHAWYGGWRGTYDNSLPKLVKLGYASSTDGIHWTKYPGNPIYQETWIEDAVVVNDGGTYYLYAEDEYTGGGAKVHIDLFTSTDRINWTRFGTVFSPTDADWESKDTGTPVVWKEGSVWYMLYEGIGASTAGQIGLATSADGKNWTRSANNPVFANPSGTHLDIAFDSILKVGQVYYTYGHYRTDPLTFVAGLFTSTDLTSWSAYSGNPITYNSAVIVDNGSAYFMYGLEASGVSGYLLSTSFPTVTPLPPGLTLNSPNGGESWTAGSTQDITWRSTGIAGNVKLEFSADNGVSWTTITAGTANDGSESWTVPAAISSECLVRVSESEDGDPADVSNGVFAIVAVPVVGDYALRFDGTNDYVEIADNALLSGGAGKSLTLEAWVKPQIVSGTRPVVEKFLDGKWKDWGLQIIDGVLEVAIESSGENWTLRGGNVGPGVWTHVAFAFANSSNVVRLFVNGVEVKKKNLTKDMPDTKAAVRIGRHGYMSQYLGGDVDEVRIWNFARSAKQIVGDMKRELSGSETGLIGYWSFNEGSGQSARDLTSSGNTGRLGSSAGDDAADPQWVPSEALVGGLGSAQGIWPSVQGIDHREGQPRRGGVLFPPASYALHQNYPNPFNPATRISYDLPEANHVRLTIYDALGQEIVVLVDDDRPAGQHHVEWNGSNRRGEMASSGVYYYQITTRRYTASKRMLLLR